MMRILLSWIGQHDLDAAAGKGGGGLGPLAAAMTERPFQEAHLLSNYAEDKVQHYLAWLKRQSSVPIELHQYALTSPVNYSEIHRAAVDVVNLVRARHGSEVPLTFHLSPGTSAMTAVWVLLGKARYRAELIQSSPMTGVQTAIVPFDISMEVIPELYRESDRAFQARAAAKAPESAHFYDIVYQSEVMRKVVERAQKAALRGVPVLLEGPSGTGKELLARAIHAASPRSAKEFVAVNCGALPESLAEAELFGSTKGAFTGADTPRIGYFKTAHQGTLFLDEIGELPLTVQVKLLRVLQTGQVTPLGSSRSEPVDVRIIAATNRTLSDEVAQGRFREDLFYRLAVAVLCLPALRDRLEDLDSLTDYILQDIHSKAKGEAGYEARSLSGDARRALRTHPWPGNVRELVNTLNRAMIWSTGSLITEADIRDALLPVHRKTDDLILAHPLGNGFKLTELLDQIEKRYLERAMRESRGNKTRAADLLGFANYQTLSGRLKRLDIEDSQAPNATPERGRKD